MRASALQLIPFRSRLPSCCWDLVRRWRWCTAGLGARCSSPARYVGEYLLGISLPGFLATLSAFFAARNCYSWRRIDSHHGDLSNSIFRYSVFEMDAHLFAVESIPRPFWSEDVVRSVFAA